MFIKSSVWGLFFLCLSVIFLSAQEPVDQAWAVLKQGTAEKSIAMRTKAVRALSLLSGNEPARQMAEQALEDPQSVVRAAAATSLGQMGECSAIPKLQAALLDKEMEVVLAAADALCQFNDPAAYEVYFEVLSGERKSGKGLVRSQLRLLKNPKALARISFEQGIEYFWFTGLGFEVIKAVMRDDASPVRAAAALKLANDADPKSGEALAKAAGNGKWLVRAAAVSAIAKRGDPALLPAIVPLLNDHNDLVRYDAAAAVIRLSGKKAR